MYMQKSLPFALTLVLISLFYSLPKTDASNFNQAYLRLDNTQANSPLSGTACAEPSSPGSATEAKVIIDFPDSFTISSNPTNFTTDTNNLSSGETPWPGIGSPATSVTGNSVTFSSSNLPSSLIYCFNFTGASSTTGNSGNNLTGTM